MEGILEVRLASCLRMQVPGLGDSGVQIKPQEGATISLLGIPVLGGQGQLLPRQGWDRGGLDASRICPKEHEVSALLLKVSGGRSLSVIGYSCASLPSFLRICKEGRRTGFLCFLRWLWGQTSYLLPVDLGGQGLQTLG